MASALLDPKPMPQSQEIPEVVRRKEKRREQGSEVSFFQTFDRGN
jgi:hypothetical protein